MYHTIYGQVSLLIIIRLPYCLQSFHSLLLRFYEAVKGCSKYNHLLISMISELVQRYFLMFRLSSFFVIELTVSWNDLDKWGRCFVVEKAGFMTEE